MLAFAVDENREFVQVRSAATFCDEFLLLACFSFSLSHTHTLSLSLSLSLTHPQAVLGQLNRPEECAFPFVRSALAVTKLLLDMLEVGAERELHACL
jgi:hypothetical protein